MRHPSASGLSSFFSCRTPCRGTSSSHASRRQAWHGDWIPLCPRSGSRNQHVQFARTARRSASAILIALHRRKSWLVPHRRCRFLPCVLRRDDHKHLRSGSQEQRKSKTAKAVIAARFLRTARAADLTGDSPGFPGRRSAVSCRSEYSRPRCPSSRALRTPNRFPRERSGR
jgi:hypothetical protein